MKTEFQAHTSHFLTGWGGGWETPNTHTQKKKGRIEKWKRNRRENRTKKNWPFHCQQNFSAVKIWRPKNLLESNTTQSVNSYISGDIRTRSVWMGEVAENAFFQGVYLAQFLFVDFFSIYFVFFLVGKTHSFCPVVVFTLDWNFSWNWIKIKRNGTKRCGNCE